jgi:hypothetical protein
MIKNTDAAAEARVDALARKQEKATQAGMAESNGKYGYTLAETRKRLTKMAKNMRRVEGETLEQFVARLRDNMSYMSAPALTDEEYLAAAKAALAK